MAVRIDFQHTGKFFVMDKGMRARPNERHFSANDVENLRQLIQAGAAQDAADARDARIALHRLAHVGAVLHHRHGAEFENIDGRLVAAPAALVEEYRARAFQLDGESNQRPQRCGDKQYQQADDDVFKALGDRRPVDQRFFFTSSRPTGPRFDTL